MLPINVAYSHTLPAAFQCQDDYPACLGLGPCLDSRWEWKFKRPIDTRGRIRSNAGLLAQSHP